MMITATTRLVALLGHPVAHSLSPRMQNAAFAARALDWTYVACDVQPDALPAAVAGLRALGFAGANVTIPHKGAVTGLCDELDDLSRRSGAVNTLVFRDGGRIVGANTDGPAVASAVDAHGAHVLVLGRGGAARAVAAALEGVGAASVHLASRADPDWPPPVGDATILVNATPLRDEAPVPPRPHQQVVDLTYRPDGRSTALVAAARDVGCSTVVDGLEILVRQGAAAFELWTGVPAPIDVMRAAVARIV
jgi:shikimate dehydrogenase